MDDENKKETGFESLIETIVRTGKLWYLSRGEEFVLTEDTWGDKLPLWPSEQEALANSTDEWQRCSAEPIPLQDFLFSWIPFLEEENIGVTLGWSETDGGRGYVIELSDLAEILRTEAVLQGVSLEEPEVDTETDKNYEQFLQDLISENKVWILRKGEAFMMLELKGKSQIPIWANEAAAAAECCEEWAECEPDWIPLEEFLEDWIPDLLEEDHADVLLSLGSGSGIGADLFLFGRDVKRELKKRSPGKVLAFRRKKKDETKETH